MKNSRKSKKKIELAVAKVNSILRHIKNVQDNCLLLGNKLIEKGDIETGISLIKNGLCHDNSKFGGIEFEYMNPSLVNNEEGVKLKLKMSIHHHQLTNPHHPEHWGSIKLMPKIYLAELSCDWKSRSEEFGTNLKEWIDDVATKRWNFSINDDVYKQIMTFVEMLCEKPFDEIK